MVDVKTSWSGLEDDEVFLRTVVFPEEERRLFTTTPWGGGFRWFRSANIVPIEKYREMKRKSRAVADRS
jgi:hypothetical protein